MTGIERLNACFKAFPEETKALLHHWIPCPPGMEDYAYHREMPDGSKTVTMLGLLNGTLFQEGDRIAYQVRQLEYPSREAEIADISAYALVPASKFVRKDFDGAGSGLVAVDPFNEVSGPTNKERYAALLRVVEFAKENGFPDAETAFWDPDDPENGQSEVEDVLVDGDPGDYTISTGIFLHKDIKFTKSTTPETDDTDSEDAVEPPEGDAP